MSASPNTEVPSRAQVVVIGGGVVGCSTAYHLATLGWTDVVLLERGQLSCGTTWHAAGLVGQLRAHENMTRLIRYSTELYDQLEAETGLATGWRRTGSISVARTPERATLLRRQAATARAYGVDCELISPAEAGEYWPLMRTDDLVGAAWLPGDGKANPTDLTQALAKGARMHGVRVVERVRVTDVTTDRGTVAGVRTDHGDIECEVVVNCAGQWAKGIGRMCGVTVPMHSAEHFYAVTDQIDGAHRDLPVLRDPDGYIYCKEEVGGLVVGGFEPDAKPWGMKGIPDPFEFQLLPEDWDQFAILMDNAIQRVPVLDRTGVRKLYNGPESFTPDGNFILGEAPELRNFYVGAGLNSAGIASAGGLGKALAEWIVAGEPSSDVWPVDIRRFARWSGNDQWLHDRTKESLGLHYAMSWPNRELASARPLRRSPTYHVLSDTGACFGTKMGWERALFFAPSGARPEVEYSFGRPNWFPYSAEEHRATRTNVAVFDQTSFAKYLLKGRDAERTLQYLCTNDIAVPPGRTVYTGMLNDRGTYESDLTVTRVDEQQYLLVTGTGQATRDFAYVEQNVPHGADATLVDLTSAYAVYGVMGPRSRELLSRVSRTRLDRGSFPFATSQEIDVGYATVRATRVTYVGELGWELYVPCEFAVAVYETLLDAGEGLGLTQGGYYAIETLRLEKAYRAWGRDVTPDYTPIEAGLGFTCKRDPDTPYRGREAVERQRAAGAGRRLVSLVLDDAEPVLWGGELILRDGEPAGHMTSAAYGHTLGASVGLGYVHRADGAVDRGWLQDGKYQIDVAGDAYDASLRLRAPYDPAMERPRA